ncbi:ParA family protein [Pedobacter sp. P351]|uniref:ParA family protein n=1 Tax=Pedobacter superstes TaxID=3133441 RepID=UPI0030A6712B
MKKKETKFIGFCGQKGGTGKSTLNTLMASYCHFLNDNKIGFMDCDYPQHSIVDLRAKEFELIKSDREYLAAFKKLSKPAYPILDSSSEKAVEDMKKFIDLQEGEAPYDFVFVDLPGTVKDKGFFKTIASLDHLFIPIIADELVIDSNLKFGNSIHHNFIGKAGQKFEGVEVRLKTMHFLWNVVDKREKTDLYSLTNDIIKEGGMKILNTQLESSVKFRKRAFRSTMFPMNKDYIKDTKVVPLIEEIIKIIR